MCGGEDLRMSGVGVEGEICGFQVCVWKGRSVDFRCMVGCLDIWISDVCRGRFVDLRCLCV